MPAGWGRLPAAAPAEGETVQALLDRLKGPLDLAVALVAVWLLASSPWIGMVHRMPDDADRINVGDVTVGFVALLIGVVYTAGGLRGSRWREYFPWAGGELGALGGDVAGMFRGRRPTVEGGVLLPTIEGLLLLAPLAAGLTGAAWFLAQGSDAAVALPVQYAVVAGAFGALLLHVVGVALLLRDFVRE